MATIFTMPGLPFYFNRMQFIKRVTELSSAYKINILCSVYESLDDKCVFKTDNF